MNWKKTLLICLIILLVGVGATTLIFMTEPTANRAGATKETAMLVEVISPERGTYQPNIVATGTVQAAQDIQLSPRVGGEIVQLSASFVPGGHVRKGQVLMQIDPADYRNTLQMRQTELRRAEVELELEKGRREVARKDYQILNDTLSGANKALVLREPQMESVKAGIDAAKTGVEQAELALQRTTIRAPFDAHILDRSVNLGSQVAPGDNLGRLVGVNEYWVVANVPMAQLQWLSFPDQHPGKGSEVRLRSRAGWPEGVYREGSLFRLMGALEEQTRLARVLVSVRDPLAYHTTATEVPPLIIGSFLETTIKGKALEDVVRLDRDYVRAASTVWVMEGGKLHIKEVDIAFQDADYAYITGGLEDTDQVVITNLTTVVDGAPLRTETSETTGPQDSTAITRSEIQSTPQPMQGSQ